MDLLRANLVHDGSTHHATLTTLGSLSARQWIEGKRANTTFFAIHDSFVLVDVQQGTFQFIRAVQWSLNRLLLRQLWWGALFGRREVDGDDWGRS